jgi:hypothetical protein
MTTAMQRIKTIPLAKAVTSMDPFRQELIGVRVTLSLYRVHTTVYGATLCVSHTSECGAIISHDCYDTDGDLCDERIVVRWDDGRIERKSLRDWSGNALGDCMAPAFLVAVA